MNFISLFLISGWIVLGLTTLVWLISLYLRNSSIADIFWGIGFIVIAGTAFVLASGGYLPRKTLISAMTTIWGIRLALHIGARNWGKPEDFRYAAWRAENGARWWWISFFKVFLLQGLLMWIVSASIIAAQASGFPAILTPLDLFGVSVWTIGLILETIADVQLDRFKRDASNKGKLLTRGVWKYSRHPNYFGEALLWWGVYLVALAAGAWWTIFSPLLMTWLLLRVSGVALLERTLKLKPGYEGYMRKTSAFVPWFPKR